MPLTLTQAIVPTRGNPTSSSEMVAFAEAINSRIMSGAGDAHWRIPYYIFSVFFRKPRLDDGTLYTPESEFFDFYQFVNPVEGDVWPVAGPQQPEGANLQTNNLNKFIFGMNYRTKEDGYYIYNREDVRASQCQSNIKSSPKNFRGFTFFYFTGVGIVGNPEYSAFGFATDYLSYGYINGNTVNPSGHSYGGYYGKIPKIISEGGCGTDSESGVRYPSSLIELHQIDETKTKRYNSCPLGSAEGVSYNNISSSSNNFIVFNNSGSLIDILDINKWHLQQYNANVFLSRQQKNHIYRILYNYITFANGFDFDWFFNHQYAYAPEIGSFSWATAKYDDDEETFLSLDDININEQRLNFNTSLTLSSTLETLVINNFASINAPENDTISSDAYIKKVKLSTNEQIANITGTSNILKLLEEIQYLSKKSSEIPTKLYNFPTSKDSVVIPKGFAFQSFEVQSTNLKKFSIEISFYKGKNSIISSSLLFTNVYDFDFSDGSNASSQVISEFLVGDNISVVFKIKNIELRTSGSAEINLQPIFLFAYKPKIEDAYALLRACTYNGLDDGDFGSSSHPFNSRVDYYDSELNVVKSIRFCKRLSEDLKKYGYIKSSSVNTPSDSHSNSNAELNNNAVFEAARRMSLYTRIVKPDNFIGIESDNKTLKFSRYARQKYVWGRMQSSSNAITVESKIVPYQKFTSIDISTTTLDANSIVFPNGSELEAGLYNYLQKYLEVPSGTSSNQLIFYNSSLELPDILNENFITNYYTGIDVYDFSNSEGVDPLEGLNRTLVKALDLDPLSSVKISFSPTSFYSGYDFVVFNASNLSSFIYYRFEKASGNNWSDGTFVSVKKYTCINGTHNPPSGDGTNEYFEWLGVLNNNTGIYGMVSEEDLTKIGSTQVILCSLKRKLTFGKDLQSAASTLFGSSNLEAVNKFYFTGKNNSLIYSSFPYDNLEVGTIKSFLQANIAGTPIKHTATTPQGAYPDQSEYFILDAELRYPESLGNNYRPMTGISDGETIPVLGSIENFSNPTPITTSTTLTAGNKYSVGGSGSQISFNGKIYLSGEQFIANSSGTYTNVIGSPTVLEYTAFKTKKIDFKLSNCVIYENGDSGGSGTISNDFSLIALLNKLIKNFYNSSPSIYLNQEDGTFSPNNPAYTLGEDDLIPTSSSDALDIYNECLAGFQIKFSYLGDERNNFNFNGPNTRLVTRSNRDDFDFWIAVYDSSDQLVSNSKIYFKYDELVTLPQLSAGQYIKFSIPINDRYIDSEIEYDYNNPITSGNLLAGNYYYLTSGRIKLDIGGGQYVYYDASDYSDGEFFVAPATGSFLADPSGSSFSLYRGTKPVPSYLNLSLYLSVCNYFFISDLTYYFSAINKGGSLAVQRSIQFLDTTKDRTTLRDIFQDIVPDPDDAQNAGKNGIIEIATSKNYTNEWALWLNFLPYNGSDTSPFKEEVYAATGSPFYDRCHINSAAIPKSQENLHLNLGLDLARYVEAPPSYRYMPLLNNKGQIFYENMAGKNENSIAFYKSCKAIIQPYKIKRAYFKVGEPDNVYIELDKELDSDGSGRNDLNGLQDWLAKGGGDGNVLFKVGDASITNANGINQITSHSSNQYKGSYYPRFFFVKLIPKPYNDDNSTLDESNDSYMNHEHIKQAELYIEAMREGFAIDTSPLAENAGCEFLSGHLTPPDYTYEQLFFDATGYNGFNGNKWPPLLTFSKSYNTLDIENKLFPALRNEDNPRGFGAVPQVGTYSEYFNSLVNAVNKLTKFRVSVPQEYYALYTFQYLADSQAGKENNWETVTKGNGKSVYVLKTLSDATPNPPSIGTQKINLRRNDGSLSPVSVNMGYAVGSFGPDNAYASLSNAYIITNRSEAQIQVLPIDADLAINAYGPIADKLDGAISVPMTYQEGQDAGILKPNEDGNITLDTCGFYYTISGQQQRVYTESFNPPQNCIIKSNLTLIPPPLIRGKPYFNSVTVRGCKTITDKGGEETIDFAGVNSTPLYITNFSSSSSTNAQIYEASWRIITSD
jgi:hypothetical protein